MALLNTLHTSEFREGWGATLRSGPARDLVRQSVRLVIFLAFLVTGFLFLYFKSLHSAIGRRLRPDARNTHPDD
jgi:hypothetical protein